MATTGVLKHPTDWHTVVSLKVHRHVRQGRCRWHVLPNWSLLYAFKGKKMTLLQVLLDQSSAVVFPQIALFLSPADVDFSACARNLQRKLLLRQSSLFFPVAAASAASSSVFKLQAGEIRLSRALEREWRRAAELASFYTFSGGGDSGLLTACLIGVLPG